MGCFSDDENKKYNPRNVRREDEDEQRVFITKIDREDERLFKKIDQVEERTTRLEERKTKNKGRFAAGQIVCQAEGNFLNKSVILDYKFDLNLLRFLMRIYFIFKLPVRADEFTVVLFEGPGSYLQRLGRPLPHLILTTFYLCTAGIYTLTRDPTLLGRM